LQREKELLSEMNLPAASYGEVHLEIGDFKGSINTFTIAYEYNFWKNVGFGIGYDMFDLKIEAQGSDYPNIDFIGEVEFKYSGLLLYTKIYF
jgi:hypothetical protein